MAVVTLPFNTQGDLLCNFDDEEKSLFFNQPRIQTNTSSNLNNNNNIVNNNQNTLFSTSIQYSHNNNNINNNNNNNISNNNNSLSLHNNLHQYPNHQVTQNTTSNHPPTELTDELSNFIFEESLLSDLYSESLPLENLLSSSGANIYPNLSSIVDTSSSSSYVNQNNTVKYAAPALVNNYPAITALPSPLVPSLPLNIKSTDSSNSSSSSSSSISTVGQQQQSQPTSVTSSVPLVVKGEPKESKEKLQVIVRHKPRGSKGIWQAIKPGERIRVDKRKGKLVLLAVRGKLPNIPASRFQEEVKLRVSLLDLKFPYFTLQQELVPLSITGPIIRTSETPEEKQTFGGNYSEVQIRVRMASISKRQGFTVTLVTKNCRMEGTSLEFSSDDNGKLYLPVGRKRKGGQTSSSSSSSSISATNSSSDLHGALSNVEIKEEREDDDDDGEETEVVSAPVVVSNGRPKRTRYSS